jgi:hypothetical protein
MLTAAGFALEAERTVTVNIEAAGSGRAATIGRYALASLRRLRGAAAEALSAEDLAALDRLLGTGGPQSIAHRDDLVVRTERSLWAARRA